MNSIASEIALPADTSSNPTTKPVADPTRLIYLTALSVILAIALAFTVPTWPWIYPIASVVLLVSGAGIYITGWQMEKALATSPSRSFWLRYKTVSPENYRRHYLMLGLRLAPGLYSMGSVFIVLQWLTMTRDWDAFKIIGPYTLTGALLFLSVALMWGRVGTSLDRALPNTLVQIPIGLLIAAGTLYLSFNSPALLGQLQAGPAAPWSAQWDLVRSQVEARYPGATLLSLTASKDYKAPNSYDAALELTFLFERVDGASAYITIRDTKPEATFHALWTDHEQGSIRSQAEMDVVKSAYPHILTSPRDALNAALTELGSSAPPPAGIVNPSISLKLADSNDPTFLQLHKPAVWQVALYGKDEGSTTVWVDAETGKVLLTEHRN